MTFTFRVDQVRTYAEDHRDGEQPLPGAEEITRLVDSAGDRFRDAFTRLCLYATHSSDAHAERSCDTVVVGSEYGNAEALARLQRDALKLGRRLSPQTFPQAISGAAAASVAMATGATGANLTLGGSLLTPVLAFWRAHTTLDRTPESTCRLLVGDVYCPETRTDASRHEPGLECRSGMTHAVLTRGDEFSAVFDFHSASDDAEPTERNGAFALGRFLRQLQDLPLGGTAVLACRNSPTQRATVRVTRMSEHTTENGRSER